MLVCLPAMPPSLHPPLQVIPFLVLAVGVDNMFILAHALHKQAPSAPIAERMGHALAAVGPSITLAASCEVVAFGMGALSGMPAVRNFSICAALAVALDFLLQVSGLPLTALPGSGACAGRWWCGACPRVLGTWQHSSQCCMAGRLSSLPCAAIPAHWGSHGLWPRHERSGLPQVSSGAGVSQHPTGSC